MSETVGSTCPTWPTLLAWLENDLPEDESRLISTHVDDCEECRERLALMNAVQDVGEVKWSTTGPTISSFDFFRKEPREESL